MNKTDELHSGSNLKVILFDAATTHGCSSMFLFQKNALFEKQARILYGASRSSLFFFFCSVPIRKELFPAGCCRSSDARLLFVSEAAFTVSGLFVEKGKERKKLSCLLTSVLTYYSTALGLAAAAPSHWLSLKPNGWRLRKSQPIRLSFVVCM